MGVVQSCANHSVLNSISHCTRKALKMSALRYTEPMNIIVNLGPKYLMAKLLIASATTV